MANTISSNDKIIDARDLRYRIDELENELENPEYLPDEVRLYFEISDAVWEAMTSEEKAAKYQLWWEEEKSDEVRELKILNAFAREIDDHCLRDGEALIHEDHFEDYARELAEDLDGQSIRNASWPMNCIDWTKAAEELKQDYTTAEFDGETYYYRS